MTQVIPQQQSSASPAWLPVFAVAFGVAGLIIGEFLPVSLLTPIAQDLRISEGTAGQLIAATSISAAIASIFVAPMTG